MENIEIRQNKKALIFVTILFTLAIIGVSYYIYFSGEFRNTWKIIYALLTVSLIYSIYIASRKFIRNEPVLTFNQSEIRINDKRKPVSFLWLQVIDWKIEEDEESGTCYLTVETADQKKKINISWLSKKPGEIEEIMNIYKRK
ncbi:MAG TPA: hypothetical protein VFZ33_05640 [Chitinophagaceae bacterium]